MINYGENISDRDIVNYWGQGYVLMKYDDVWSCYRLTDVAGDTCTLNRAGDGELVDGRAPRVVNVTKPDFFEQCLLHRPVLGVVVCPQVRKLIHLSWVPASPNQIKALSDNDVHITPLAPIKQLKKAERVPGPNEPADIRKAAGGHVLKENGDAIAYVRGLIMAGHTMNIKHVLNLFEVQQTTYINNHSGGAAVARRGLLARRGDDGLGMRMLVKYLNMPKLSFMDVLAKAADQSVAPLREDWWIKVTPKGTSTLHIGEILIGTLRNPSATKCDITISANAGKDATTVYAEMAKAMLREIGVRLTVKGEKL